MKQILKKNIKSKIKINYFSFTLINPIIEITEIKITDLNGRLVKTVFKGNLVSGVHRFTENLSMLSSGIYILNFSTTSGLNQSHKLVKF